MTTQPVLPDLVETHYENLDNLSPQQAQPRQHATADSLNTAAASISTHIQLTGRLLNFTRLNIEGNDVKTILIKLAKKLGRQRQSNLPVIVSCQTKLNLAQLWGGLWALGLQPIGIVTSEHDDEATALRIPIFPADGQRIDGKNIPKKTPAHDQAEENKTGANQEKSTDTKEISEKNATLIPALVKSETVLANAFDTTPSKPDKFVASQHQQSHLEGDLVHRQILRSGQSINHVGGDVILTKGINAGAEAITDYNLHVYGKAEGRLVAGATGDINAKIFCLRFNPSLVSVAGTYCLKENIPAEYLDKSVQVSYLEGQGLVFELME